MKNYYFAVILCSTLLISCNKKSIIEGFVPNEKVVTFSTPIFYSYSSGRNVFTMSQLHPYAKMVFEFSKFIFNSGTDWAPSFAFNDSILIAVCTYTYLSSNDQKAVNTFNKGDKFDISKIKINNYGTILASFYKHKPYTGTTWKNNSFSNTSVVMNKDCYIAFQFDNPTVNYGWIHLLFDDLGMTIFGYGYQTFDPPIIGK